MLAFVRVELIIGLLFNIEITVKHGSVLVTQSHVALTRSDSTELRQVETYLVLYTPVLLQSSLDRIAKGGANSVTNCIKR